MLQLTATSHRKNILDFGPTARFADAFRVGHHTARTITCVRFRSLSFARETRGESCQTVLLCVRDVAVALLREFPAKLNLNVRNSDTGRVLRANERRS